MWNGGIQRRSAAWVSYKLRLRADDVAVTGHRWPSGGITRRQRISENRRVAHRDVLLLLLCATKRKKPYALGRDATTRAVPSQM